MAFLLLQTAKLANDAYVVLYGERRFMRALFIFWSPQMAKVLAMFNALLSPNLSLE
ncbi:hypothetical protein HMPREF0026_02470 [Acinetobacter junii SH205]|jgi:hypothetical protein|uniref:Uncharacterized protein n=1 Tax=Acinetobacter junii SH205 TaxID=575587 RepID=D0SPR0_ACIJU|nr:hypothetical protein HMPREF0026_02470 [Acinetobacter junii SH205]ENV48968.1 hypothetical protein F953_03452 [Acinetobacter junii CIP 107470 = MTCC 11364]MBY3624432.1 hypothetical protein [Acinetobacter sp. CUI P1]VTX92922.1 Uncharacterised protein [Acinetobacter junii]